MTLLSTCMQEEAFEVWWPSKGTPKRPKRLTMPLKAPIIRALRKLESPSSRGLGLQVFILATGVRLP